MSTVYIWIFSFQGKGVILFSWNACPTCQHLNLGNGPSWWLWEIYTVPTAQLNIRENLLLSALEGEHDKSAQLPQLSDSFSAVFSSTPTLSWWSHKGGVCVEVNAGAIVATGWTGPRTRPGEVGGGVTISFPAAVLSTVGRLAWSA